MGSGRPSKAKRGKHRWIGLCVAESLDERESLSTFLESHLELIHDWRLFDLQLTDDGLRAIIRVRLEDYPAALEALSEGKVVSMTASGKIRLVRERLGLQRPARRRSG